MRGFSSFIPFTKMHGCGNDFVVVDCRNVSSSISNFDFPALARSMLDRHLGIGGDQLLLVCDSSLPSTARCTMRIFNTDGREAEMCGNGLRAVALFVSTEVGSSFVVDTLAGPRHVKVEDEGSVSVEMGEPKLFQKDAVPLLGHLWHKVSMGNPHAVTVVADVEKIDLVALGQAVEREWDCNVEIVELKSKSHCVARVWERSVGITMACGSGACAIFAALRSQNLVDDVLRVQFPGGELRISDNITMTGPAVTVFQGQWPV